MFDASNVIDLHRLRSSRPAAALLVSVATWAISVLGGFRALDGLVYDQVVRVSAWLDDEPATVLAVALDASTTIDEALCRSIIDGLRPLEARTIVFTEAPADASEEFYRDVAAQADVVLGRRLVPDPLEPESPDIEPLPEAALRVDRPPRFGVTFIEPGVKGIHRWQRGWHVVGELAEPSIEVAAVGPRVRERVLGERAVFPLAFRGGAGSLPTVDLERVVEGGLVPEIVRDRVVIIGRVSDDPESGVVTPTTGASRMSPLEYHAHAIETLSTGQVRWPVQGWTLLVVLAALAVLSAWVFQWTDAVLGSWTTLGLAAASAIVGVALYIYGDTWAPVTEIACNQAVFLIVALRTQAVTTSTQLRGLLVSATSRIEDKHLPLEMEVESETWPLIVNMVHQTLDLTRVIFLETQPDRSLLIEVRALNCSFEDISERRRDYERAPYITAVEAAGPIRVEGYLKKAYDREEQYIVPLIFGGEVLGFWACGVDPAKVANVPVFENILRDYAALISELLYQRRQATRGRSFLRRAEAFLTRERGDDMYEELKTTLEILEGRLRQVEGLLADINTATIVYDLFGRVLHVNDRMLELLEGERLSPQSMTALDLVSAVSEYDLSRSRRILRHVIIDQQVITIPVRLARQSGSRYVMHLHPLQVSSADKTGDALKNLSGKSVLCELVDTTAFSGMFEMKEKLAARLGLQLRNDLASIDLSSSLLGSSELSREQRSHVASIIHEKVNRTMDVLVECQQYLTLDSETDSVERFPVDSQDVFRAAADSLRDPLARRGLELAVEEPKLMSFVLASTESLQAVFVTTLNLLIADATDQSALSVSIDEGEDLVTYRFKNTGFGIPNERFQEYIFGDSTLASEDLKALRDGIGWVEAWGGEIEAHSEVGMGTEVIVRLVKFI